MQDEAGLITLTGADEVEQVVGEAEAVEVSGEDLDVGVLGEAVEDEDSKKPAPPIILWIVTRRKMEVGLW